MLARFAKNVLRSFRALVFMLASHFITSCCDHISVQPVKYDHKLGKVVVISIHIFKHVLLFSTDGVSAFHQNTVIVVQK